MLVSGIVGHESISKTASLISSILCSVSKKASITSYSKLSEMEPSILISYFDELKENKTDVLIIKIDISEIEKEIFNNLHFDIMIFADKTDDLKGGNLENYRNLLNRIFSLLHDKDVLIVNVDDNEFIRLLQGKRYYVVTYGFNPKASITTSSVGDEVYKESFMCCLQRSVYAKNGVIIEPQEYRITLEPGDIHIYNVLAAAAFSISIGVDLNTINFNTFRL